MIFSIGVMIMLAMISYVSNGNLTGDGFTANTTGGTTINGSTSTFEGQGGGIFNFDLFSGTGLVATLILLAAAGILAGIGLFGSGLSDTSQVILIKSVGFLGLWGALTIFSSPLILDDTGLFGILIYFGLTMVFGIGFVFDIAGSGE